VRRYLTQLDEKVERLAEKSFSKSSRRAGNPEPHMNQQITRELPWNITALCRILFYGMLISHIFSNDEIAEAAGFFRFPYYLVAMMELL